MHVPNLLKTRIWFSLFIVLTSFSVVTAQEEKKVDSKRPNIVFFLVDDLGAMDIGAYNPNTFYETPNVDHLAATGVKFTQGYASCCVCSPTRFSLMTGKYPVRNACTDWFGANRSERFAPASYRGRLDLNETTIAEAFKEAGYRTAFLGKWHLGPTEEFWAEKQGFDINLGGCHRGNPKSYFSPYQNPRLEDGLDGEFLTERLTNEAIKIIKNWKDDPFFLYFSFYQVHTPLQAPESLVEKYRQKAFRNGLPNRTEEIFVEEEQNFSINKPRLTRQHQTHAIYAGMVEAMDTAVGRVLETLKNENLLNNTIICFVSDNGGLSTSEGSPTSNSPFRAGKGWNYEGGIRVPFVIRIPNGVSKISDFPTITTDFYPTLLDLADIPLKPEQHLDGVSLKSILEDKKPPQRDTLYWHYPHYSNQGGFPSSAVRFGNWKLIQRLEDGRTHLYNIKEDIGEQNDLVAKYPEKVIELQKLLFDWYREMDARFLQPKNNNIPWLPPTSIKFQQ
ncbi:MAG: sulfatase [Planctomycetaceae bacterium]|jgi:arylsulfatase A-like enzyme|nr:sulfatase [Planctomycetaceae bacterium]